MAGMDVPARRANSSASMMLSPDETRIGVAPGGVSASAIRAMDVPITRAICTADSTSTRSMATIDWNRRTASMSISVKAASSSPTSRKPNALQNRRATSMGMSVVSATWAWVRRRPVGTSIRSTTNRSTTSSATAWSISASVQPRPRRRERTRASASTRRRNIGGLVVRHGHTLTVPDRSAPGPDHTRSGWPAPRRPTNAGRRRPTNAGRRRRPRTLSWWQSTPTGHRDRSHPLSIGPPGCADPGQGLRPGQTTPPPGPERARARRPGAGHGRPCGRCRRSAACRRGVRRHRGGRVGPGPRRAGGVGAGTRAERRGGGRRRPSGGQWA